MSGPPPGYNPNESMLQGGDAPIQPMMGGGMGSAPPGYNAETSLLQGGEATIQPVMGGGAEGGVEGGADTTEGGGGTCDTQCNRDIVVRRAVAAATTEIAKAADTPLVQSQAIAAASAAAGIVVDRGGSEEQATEAAKKAALAITQPCESCGQPRPAEGECTCALRPPPICDGSATEDTVPDQPGPLRDAIVTMKSAQLSLAQLASIRRFLRQIVQYPRPGATPFLDGLYQRAKEGAEPVPVLSGHLDALLQDYTRQQTAHETRKADLVPLLEDASKTDSERTALQAISDFYERLEDREATEEDVGKAYRKALIVAKGSAAAATLEPAVEQAMELYRTGQDRTCLIVVPGPEPAKIGDIEISDEAKRILDGVALGDREQVNKASTAAYAIVVRNGDVEAAQKAAVAAGVMEAKRLQDAAAARLADEEARRRAEDLKALEDELRRRKALEDQKEAEDEVDDEDPKPVMVEYYSLEEIKPFYISLLNQKRNLLANDASWRSYITDAMNDYEARKLAEWRAASRGRMPTVPVTGAFREMRPNETITTFSRLYTVLPNDTVNLVILPPMTGDDVLFLNTLQTLEQLGLLRPAEKELKLAPGAVLVFTSPFYARPTDLTLMNPVSTEQIRRQNMVLLSLFLDLERANQGFVYALSEQTPDNFVVGEMFHTRRQVPQGRPTALINMLEPSYVVYPYKRGERDGIVISSSNPAEPVLPGPNVAAAGSRLSQLAANPKQGGRGFSLTYKPNSLVDDAEGYFSVRSLRPPKPIEVPERATQSDSACANLIAKVRLDDLHPQQFLTPALLKDETGALQEQNLLLVVRLDAMKATYAPLCQGVDGLTIRPMQRLDKFYAAKPEELHIRGVDVILAEVNARLYKLRKPAAFDGNKVMADWKMERYTEDEAAFLNDLNLRPGMLEEIYPITLGRTWQEYVADFLKSMSYSMCFKDETLLTKRECEIARIFMNNVMDYFVEHEISATHLKEEEADKERVERLRVRRQQTEAKEIQTDLALRPPDMAEAAEVDPADFAIQKKDWNQLAVRYEVEDGQRPVVATSLIMVNKEDGSYKFITVRIPRDEFDADPGALTAKINSLKEKYVGYHFIY